MAQISSLDRVIEKVTAGAKPDTSAAQKIIIIDAKKKKAVEKKFLSFGDLRYYRVSNNSDVRNTAKSAIPSFHLQDLEHSVSVCVESFQVSCSPGNEEQVAESLFDPSSSPREVLDRHITKWLIECSRDELTKFIDKYFSNRQGLQAGIRERALKETGLDLQVKIALDAEKSFTSIQVEKEHHPILVKNSDEEQDLKFKVRLEIDENNRTNAVLYYSHSNNVRLEELIPREIEKYIKQNVSMQEFYTELSQGPVKEALIDHLDNVLKPVGRKISSLVLDAYRPEGLKFFFQNQRAVKCEVQQYPDPILINNKIQMILKDVARYKDVASPDLEIWVQEKLDRFIPQLLFSAKYIDVLLGFQRLENDIKKALSDEAAIIGYEIKQLITVPDLEPLRWKDSFPVYAEDTFETRLSNVHVKLRIVITTRINNLEKIKSFLNRQQNVPKLMEESVLNVTRQFLHKIEPERFYMRFNFSDRDDEKPVESELIELITNELTSRYHAEVIDVIPKVVDTDLITRLRKLQEKICPFKVDILSLRGGEEVVFKGKFKVEAVDSAGWHKFQMRNYSLDEIRQHLEDYIGATLETLPEDDLVYKDPIKRKELETLIRRLVEQNIVEEFGLVINVNTIHREHTIAEIATNEQVVGRYEARLKLVGGYLEDKVTADLEINKEKVAQLRKLLEKRTSLTGQEGTEDDIADLDGKIKKIRDELAAEPIPSIKDVENLFLSGSARKTSLGEFSKILGLPEAPDNNNGQKESDE